jgi:hypothetical protein
MAGGDTIRLPLAPANVAKTDFAQGGQQISLGHLGRHGQHGRLTKNSPFSSASPTRKQKSP